MGYLVQIPLSTFYELGQPGEEVSLRVHTHVRDVALELYGFRSAAEQGLFEALISVSGIGPKLAITILSGMEPNVLMGAIAGSDVVKLTGIPGVGRKTAERMILELREKVAEMGIAAGNAVSAGSPARDDVLSALLNLGYKQRDAESALASVDEDAAESFEALLRQTLKALSR